ncbi:MAG: outer membrane protein transport protein [Deltaproteobacteria bacterium]|nr:outer membrane protein transport protein [Deltaproteobacteria bacterium]
MIEPALRRRIVAGALAVAVATSASAASAAGLYFSDRGVRPVGRAGAFVAGADDLGAIWYNPAGIAFAGETVLADFSWLRFRSTYQRRSLVRDPATGDEVVQGSNYFPEVEGTSPVLPLPTVAVSNRLGLDEKWNFAASVMAPYSALTSYPETDMQHRGRTVPPPQRYSLVTLDGSALAVIGLTASYKPSDKFALGAGLQMLTGTFASRLAFNACPPQALLCAQEDPQYDAYTQLKVGPIFAPSANAGFIAIVSDSPGAQLRIGGSFQLPFWVNSPASTKIRLPSAAVFRDAYVEGDQARVSFRLPAIARLGLETRLGEKKQTRLEVAVFYEAWSMHDRITIKPAGDGIRLRNVTGFPDPYEVGELAQARGFRDTFSIHGGVEHEFDAGGYPMALRAGASYERSAVPPEYLSVLTVDLDKIQIAAGSSLWVAQKRNLRLDAVIGYTFGFTTDVDPRSAKITKVKVVRANDPAEQDQTKINGGRYTAGAMLLGVGLVWKY